MISVIVCVYKPRKTLNKCIRHLLNSSFRNFEIIVVEQLGRGQKSSSLLEFKNGKIRYYSIGKIGLSRARNYGINESRGNIIAFTDDDCYVDKNWLKNISNSFKKYPTVCGVFGRTLPYKKTAQENVFFPCIFTKSFSEIISEPSRHWLNIGFGNNMAFRKWTLSKLGPFKEWLGNGSIGESAEDAEMCLRTLLAGFNLSYCADALVHHDRILKVGSHSYIRQMRSYNCGELAAYGYYAIQGNVLAINVVQEHIVNRAKELKGIIKTSLSHPSLCNLGLGIFLVDLLFDIKGIFVGSWHAATEHTDKKRFVF